MSDLSSLQGSPRAAGAVARNGFRAGVGSGSETAAFLEHCTGPLLCLAMDPNGALQSISPALEAALGDRMDGARLARLLEGTEAGFSTVATLQLADGTRLVGMTESAPARVERQLKHFADSHGLSPAERVALTDVAAGASAKASAERLGLSAETVRARRKRIFRRVGVDSCGAVLAMLLREQ